MQIFSQLDRNGTYVTSSFDLTTETIDVSHFTNIQVTSFSNVNMILTLNWGVSKYPVDYVDYITITSGDTVSKQIRCKSKYFSVTYYNTDVNYTTRTTFLFS